MNVQDKLEPARIARVTLLVYEGEIERDANGNIINKLRETREYIRPVERVIVDNPE